MDGLTYQRLAGRTECGQDLSRMRIASDHPRSTRLLHAVIGLCSDAGEVAACVERWLYYGQEMDITNLREELGDCLWYIALACNAAGFSLDEVMEGNIAKLKRRYPEKFEAARSLEENRDREKEREAIETCSLCMDTVVGMDCPACEGGKEEHRVNEYMKDKYRGKLCPHCGGPIGDEAVMKLAEGKWRQTGCPNCLGQFVAERVDDGWELKRV